MKEVLAFYPILIDGTITTIILTVLSAILALGISFVVGLSRISKFKIVRVLAIIYLEFFRGSSALVQMFFIYFVFINQVIFINFIEIFYFFFISITF